VTAAGFSDPFSDGRGHDLAYSGNARRCNYGDVSRVAAANSRERIARLQQVVEEQQQQIDRLLEKVARYEEANGGELAPGLTPAIY
jgi:hypothetical protein